MYLTGLLIALGIFILIWKLPKPIRLKILGIDVYVDILVSLLLLTNLGHTYSGMAASVVAGIVFSISLYIMKKLQGYEILQFQPRPHWAFYPPRRRNRNA